MFLFTAVLKHVAIEMTLHRKTLVAYFALIVFFFVVPLNMTGKVALLSVPFATPLTLVWFVSVNKVVCVLYGYCARILKGVLQRVGHYVGDGVILQVVIMVKTTGMVMDDCLCSDSCSMTYFVIFSKVRNMQPFHSEAQILEH